MAKHPELLDRSTHATLQMRIAFPTKSAIDLDPKTRAEVVVLLGRLFMQVAQEQIKREVRDDAS